MKFKATELIIIRCLASHINNSSGDVINEFINEQTTSMLDTGQLLILKLNQKKIIFRFKRFCFFFQLHNRHESKRILNEIH